MKKLFLIVTIITLVLSVQAQNESQVVKTIKGKVVNEATNESVPYTNISIEGTFYGTASNQEGEFELKIPEEMAGGQIQFSAVGYKNEKYPVQTYFNREFNIVKLEPTSYDIDDVDVAARSRVIERILRMASENIPYNFIGGPFNLECIYENQKIIDDTTEVLQKAEVLIYDKTGYVQPSKLNAFRMRKYEITQAEPAYSFSSGILNLDELVGTDWVRSASSVLKPSLLYQFNLKLEEETEIDGNPAWIITFSQDEPTLAGSDDFHATSFSGQITVVKEDYSVKKIEGSVQSAKHNRQGKSLAVGNSNSNYFENVTYNFSVTYSQLKPDVIMLNKKYDYNGRQVAEKTTLTINRVQMADVKVVDSRDYFPVSD
ncbi:MAG: carboxypeptidase-like regulatory domain-containing protein [Bacteroidota bacterium]